MSKITLKAGYAQAEIDRRKNNKQADVYEAAGPEVLAYAKFLGRGITGAELVALASVKPAARKAPAKAKPAPEAPAKVTPEANADEMALAKAARKAATELATEYANEHAPEGKFMRTMIAERTRLLAL